MAGCQPQAEPAQTGKKIKIGIDPVTRIEGHLKAEVEVAGGKVVDAHITGGMYRGFEQILVGRDPRDATQITQRICGVCPTAHATASALALDDAFGVELTDNGRIARNLILGANFLQSHILHFYHLAALDYCNGPETAPFIPRYANNDMRLPKELNDVAVGQYLEALEIRKICHEMVALLGGKMPHVQGIVVGGSTEIPTREALNAYAERFKKVKQFVLEKYIPIVYLLAGPYGDLLKTGVGHKNLVSWGVFPLDNKGNTLLKSGVYTDGKDYAVDPAMIKEYVKYSWFEDSTTGLNPTEGKTLPNPDKPGAYSFIKAPRYNGKPHEGGPLARMWATNPELSATGQKELGVTRLRDIGDACFSILGRHVARAEETALVAAAVEEWLSQAQPGKETFVPAPIPDSAQGLGMTEAPRGALLHYIDIKDQKIANYQITSATIWNANPRDDMGQRGPIEEALIGVPVPDVNSPVNVGRLIRSFDP
ncbi:MAG: nickel-dependent hydrogenase large subunit [Desulfotignum balticum]|jgi:hydrogenase large subunit|uniref:Nickel-dependent hydrogenase large subunit n=1 Tax=Desulfotignum balticum TaxID=115781 RepID=A0A931GBC9_9BACT|nr:nickel-dependent hydrogenase large subunit [Desulfotignum balticum]